MDSNSRVWKNWGEDVGIEFGDWTSINRCVWYSLPYTFYILHLSILLLLVWCLQFDCLLYLFNCIVLKWIFRKSNSTPYLGLFTFRTTWVRLFFELIPCSLIAAFIHPSKEVLFVYSDWLLFPQNSAAPIFNYWDIKLLIDYWNRIINWL